MKTEVTELQPWELLEWHWPATGYWGYREDGRLCAIGSMHERKDGGAWATLQVRDVRNPVALCRNIVRVFRASPGPIYAACQRDTFPKAPRLLWLLGCRPTGDTFQGMEVWRWQR